MFGTPFAGQGVGGSLSNLASGFADPKVALSLGAVGADSAYQQMQEDMEAGVTAANEKIKQDRLQSYLDNPEPVIYSANGGLTQYALGGLTEKLKETFREKTSEEKAIANQERFDANKRESLARYNKSVAERDARANYRQGEYDKRADFVKSKVEANNYVKKLAEEYMDGTKTFGQFMEKYGTVPEIKENFIKDNYPEVYERQTLKGALKEFGNTLSPVPMDKKMSGGPTQYLMGGLVNSVTDEEDRDEYVPTGNTFLGIDMGALMANDINALAANNAIDPTATYGETSNRDTLEDDQVNLNIAQRKTYPVNPQFRAGFQPETMYFDPATINPSYSKLTNQSPGASFGPADTAALDPDLLATAQYASKGGYNPNNPMVNPRLGGQVIDPYTAYTGVEPPKVLEAEPMANGGETELPNAGLKALQKASPETVKSMGYAEGGMPDNSLIEDAKAFILGETDDESIVEEFINSYGAEAFMALRDTVLKSITNPDAQTEGLIAGVGNGGMDDDLLGSIGGKEAIAVSQEEFIVPADVVSMLGDGSSDAGAKELYAMMDRVRQEKTGSTMQAPKLPNGMMPV